jgi:hypothetical protein
MVEVEFRPGKQRKPEALRVIVFNYGKAGLDVISGTNGPVGFLALVKEIEGRAGLKNPVRINQKKGRENGVRLLNYGASRIRKKFPFNNAFFTACVPKILYPCPGFVVNIDKILIIKVNFGEISSGHKCSLDFAG